MVKQSLRRDTTAGPGVALRRATSADADRVLAMVAAFHAHEGVALTDAQRRAAVLPMLEPGDVGGVWLVEVDGAVRGYVALGFSWSIEFGGRDAWIDEVWVEPNARGRGLGRAVFSLLGPVAREAGIKAVHLEVDPANETAQRLYARAGLVLREYRLMSARLDERDKSPVDAARRNSHMGADFERDKP